MSRRDPCGSVRIACVPGFGRIRRVVATGANRSHCTNLVGMVREAPADHGGTVFDPASVRWGVNSVAAVLLRTGFGPGRSWARATTTRRTPRGCRGHRARQRRVSACVFFGAHGLLGCSASTSCQQFVPPSVWQVKSVPPMAGHPRFVRPLARALAPCRVASTGGYRRWGLGRGAHSSQTIKTNRTWKRTSMWRYYPPAPIVSGITKAGIRITGL